MLSIQWKVNKVDEGGVITLQNVKFGTFAVSFGADVSEFPHEFSIPRISKFF